MSAQIRFIGRLEDGAVGGEILLDDEVVGTILSMSLAQWDRLRDVEALQDRTPPNRIVKVESS